MDFEFLSSQERYNVSVEFKNGQYFVSLRGDTFIVDFHPLSPYSFSILLGDRSYTVYLAEDNGKKYISIGGEHFCIEEAEKKVRDKRFTPTPSTVEGKQCLSAPLPGLVVKIQVSEGEVVRKNQGLVILESMKMENELRSPFPGRVEKIFVSSGDLVNAGQSLVEILPVS